MENYLEISNILFENREKLSNGIYLKLMNMIKNDYENNTLLFTHYIIHNDNFLDDQVILDLLVIVLKNLKDLVLKEKREQNKIFIYKKVIPVIIFLSHIYSFLN